MRKLRYLLMAAVVSGLLFFAATPVLAQNTSRGQACMALRDFNPDGEACRASDSGVNKIIKLALNLLSMVAGVIAVIMIIVSGFKYVTSQGDASSISSAKQSLIYAIVGLVVVAMAQFIVRFVLAKTIQA